MKRSTIFCLFLTFICAASGAASGEDPETLIVDQSVAWKAIQKVAPSTPSESLNSSLAELIQKADKVIREKSPVGETRVQREARVAEQRKKLNELFAGQTFVAKPVTVTFEVADVMQSQPPKPKALSVDATDKERAQYDAELAASQSFQYLVVGNVKSSSKPVLTRFQLQEIKTAEDSDNARQRLLDSSPGARGAARRNTLESDPRGNAPATKQRVQKDANSIVPPHVIKFYGTNGAVLKWKKGQTHHLKGYIQSLSVIEQPIHAVDAPEKVDYLLVRATLMLIDDEGESKSTTKPATMPSAIVHAEAKPLAKIGGTPVQNGPTTGPSKEVTYRSLSEAAKAACQKRDKLLQNKLAPDATVAQKKEFDDSQRKKGDELNMTLTGLTVLADFPVGDVRKARGGDTSHPAYEILEWSLAPHGGFNFHAVVHSNDDHVLSWKKGDKHPCRATITKIEWTNRINGKQQVETDGLAVWLDAVDASETKAKK